MTNDMGGREAAAGLLCPACHVSLMMSERQGIEIDYCPRCRGVWLDRGELDKILERSAAELPPAQAQAQAPQPEYRRDHDRDRDHHHEGYKPHKRRRSFLDDLFDD
jgi:Zn-finger nucleic acid-binding protein